jgi:hypothetical protein
MFLRFGMNSPTGADDWKMVADVVAWLDDKNKNQKMIK